MTIRPATEADLEALIALRVQLLEAEVPEFDVALSSWFRSHLADRSFLAWVADDSGRVVAASGLTVIDRPPYPGNHGGLDGYVINMTPCQPIGGGDWRGSCWKS